MGKATEDEERMKNIYLKLFELIEQRRPLALATIIEASGSTPQKAGVSSAFSSKELLLGTLGGGLLEADAEKKASRALKRKTSLVYEFNLDEDIASEEVAVCGGRVKVLIDVSPQKNRKAFESLQQSFSERKPGILASLIQIDAMSKVGISRFWLEKGKKPLAVKTQLAMVHIAPCSAWFRAGIIPVVRKSPQYKSGKTMPPRAKGPSESTRSRGEM